MQLRALWLLLLLLPTVCGLTLGQPAAISYVPTGARPCASGVRVGAICMAQVKLTGNGKTCKVGEGSSMLAACKKLGMNIKTNCKKGDCGTCTVKCGGKAIRACVGKVPPAPRLKSVQEKGLPVSR